MISKKIKNIFLFFPLLFMFELVFGHTGKLIMLRNIPIRLILFFACFISLYSFWFYCLRLKKIKLSQYKKQDIIKSFNLIDMAFICFFISTIISIIIVPLVLGNSIKLALRETTGFFSILILYFPMSFLIKEKQINFKNIEKVLSFFIAGFSLVHIILYIGQSHYPDFIKGYFNFLNNLFGGTSIIPPIILGHNGYTRVIFINSIFILIGICIILRHINSLKFYEYIFLGLEVVAILCTVTKSIWLGSILGGFIFSIFYLLNVFKDKNFKKSLHFLIILVFIIILTIVMNNTLFNNIIKVKSENYFISSYTNKYKNKDLQKSADKSEDLQKSNDKNEENYLREIDREGAIISNDIKIEQTFKLINKWKESPIFGHGYGSYIKDYKRSEGAFFSYEMQAPALFMKIGIVGTFCWIFLIVSLIITMFKSSLSKIGKKRKFKNIEQLLAWLFLLISYVITTQTNPFLLSSIGMGLILYMILYCIDYSVNKKVKDEE